jgi:hypothetical protein
MSNYLRQHILPKTYLKYFSKDNSGKGIFTIDLSLQDTRVQIKNPGDNIFWRKNYYTDGRFEDKFVIEKSLGIIESSYNKIINSIIKEETKISSEVKNNLIRWIIYSKLRSPIIRMDYERKTRFKISFADLVSNESDSQFQIILDQLNRHSKEYHLDHFFDTELFNKTFNDLATCALTKQWEILIAPQTMKFWTSDNPGFTIFADRYEKTGLTIPYPFFNKTTSDSHHFFPLTNKYCLELIPYEKGSKINHDLNDELVKYKKIDNGRCNKINQFTAMTACNFLIVDESQF